FRSHTAPNGSSRHEKSLGLLTIKFVTLLQESENGVLDLKVAADTLAVRQKRRIYDITNVLEGIGLIEKKTKNTIQWKGESSGCQPQEILEQVELLKAQISELERQEKELDIQKEFLQQSNKHLKEDPNSIRYPFNQDDICNVFSGDTLLAVMAPAGTQLEVPVPEMAQNGQKRYQVNLRSQSSPIQVMLINRETGSSKPVVFSVPPPDDIYTMPTPPSTPASQQRFPIPSDPCSMGHTQLKSPASEHQLTPSSTPPDIHMGTCLSVSRLLSNALMSLSESISILDVGSLLRLNTVDQMKEEKEGKMFPLLRLSPNPGVDYNFNLDDNEGVCDLFDVQILNY
uniref:E2F/DP family winged-helix DNA-binding domain-containing protein n=1 Tax=Electrophorus electricus TaxID=8005 RepID=A0AAY5F3T7_ELEEL